jgi:predicted ABC-type ATPase
MRISEFIWPDLQEGVFDPYTFKAVFMAGPPGAGKSTVRDALFAGKGLKIVDPDYIHSLLQRSLREDELSFNPQRNTAIRLRNQFISQGLGFILDGTNPDPTEVLFVQKQLQDRGYDVSMVLVNAPLDVCLDRIHDREQRTGRIVDEAYARGVHKRIQGNRDQYRAMFGNQFFEIVNDKPQLEMGVSRRKILNWLSTPVDAPAALSKDPQ